MRADPFLWYAAGTAAVLVIATALYVVLAWQRAPKVYRGMKLVVVASLGAGVLMGICAQRVITELESKGGSTDSSKGASDDSSKAVSELGSDPCSPDGVSAAALGKAIVLNDQKHASVFDIARGGKLLWSVDLFRCESILLKSYWIMVVMDVFTRRIIGFGVAMADVDGPDICRMFNRAIAQQTPPKYLSSDNDPLFRFHQWLANLRILEVDEIKAIPCTPRSHAFVERLIGTVRREYLDRTLFWNQGDLERKLDNYKAYYNQHRCHTGLAGVTPADRSGAPRHPIASLPSHQWRQHCQGLFQTPIAA